eukprot:CAMPEP_0196809804 /NCGR_PEP_ID=MMETSP1362-20130617/9683_1 /TAXON_ID=163516 /ORGANISM="Leptocylindrus danicus, Strain CCMP1856" /LENGTH=31 /DNA_ID= /DNA_START= /DNA_END= /DNA_ORIENTATION=
MEGSRDGGGGVARGATISLAGCCGDEKSDDA